MAFCTQRLAGDWLGAFGHTALVAETFVDPEQLVGTGYKAAGWQCLGPTGGFTRDYRDYYLDLEAPKQLWVRPLHPRALEWLSAPVPAELAPLAESAGLRRSLPLHGAAGARACQAAVRPPQRQPRLFRKSSVSGTAERPSALHPRARNDFDAAVGPAWLSGIFP